MKWLNSATPFGLYSSQASVHRNAQMPEVDDYRGEIRIFKSYQKRLGSSTGIIYAAPELAPSEIEVGTSIPTPAMIAPPIRV